MCSILIQQYVIYVYASINMDMHMCVYPCIKYRFASSKLKKSYYVRGVQHSFSTVHCYSTMPED